MDLRVIDHRHHRVESALSDVEDLAHVGLDVFAGQTCGGTAVAVAAIVAGW